MQSLRFPVLPLAACALLAPPCLAQVLYFENFNQPELDVGSFLEISSGVHTFSNPGWLVTNVSDLVDQEVGVFIDNQFLFPSGQVLAFGGGQSPIGNKIETTIGGFSGTNLPTISFDFYTIGTNTQGIRVDVTDPWNSEAVLYSASFTSTGKVLGSPFLNVPTGDSVRVIVSQVGSTMGSDSAIDNLLIVATAVPEPSACFLAALGVVSTLSLRRREWITKENG